MYCKHFGLLKKPFHITPDPEFLYLNPGHQKALAAMIYGVEKRKGLVAVTGDVGLGKTTLIRAFLERLDKDAVKVVYVFNTNISFQGVLKVIHRELGLEVPSDDLHEQMDQLSAFLTEENKQGRNVVMVVDEAHGMPATTLEYLTMLTRLETCEEKLLQILLVGQPELQALLDRDELRQLKQSIAVRATLTPLSAKESRDYIGHRLGKAGGNAAVIFKRRALKHIIGYGEGVPRKINIICDNALIGSYGHLETAVTAKSVKEAVADLEGRPSTPIPRWAFVAGGLLLCGALFVAYRHGAPILSKLSVSSLFSHPKPPVSFRNSPPEKVSTADERETQSSPAVAVRVPEPPSGHSPAPQSDKSDGMTGLSKEPLGTAPDNQRVEQPAKPNSDETTLPAVTELSKFPEEKQEQNTATPRAKEEETLDHKMTMGEENEPLSKSERFPIIQDDVERMLRARKAFPPPAKKEEPPGRDQTARELGTTEPTEEPAQERVHTPQPIEATPPVDPTEVEESREAPDPSKVIDWLLKKRSRKSL